MGDKSLKLTCTVRYHSGLNIFFTFLLLCHTPLARALIVLGPGDYRERAA